MRSSSPARASCAPLLSLVLSSLSVACGGVDDAAALPRAAASHEAQAIIGGASCDGRYPSALAIVLDATIDPGTGVEDVTRLMCTGTLIAPDVVLTAAHCTESKLLTGGRDTVSRADYWVTFAKDLSALAGADTPAVPLPDDAVYVRALVPQDGFDITSCCAPGLGDVKDIALLFLDTPISAVEPAVVLQKDEVAQLAVGAAVGVAGWGKQTPEVNAPAGTVGLELCGDTTINEVGATEMQIGGDDTSTRKCQGDSGGPTYLDVHTDHAIATRVIGVTSHQYDATGCTKGGIDTRVDAYFDWIDAQMRARCDDHSRAWCDVPGVVPASFYDPPAAATDDDDDDDDGAAGCTASGRGVTWALGAALLALALLRRRR